VFSQIAPPQYFTITLIAASYDGYASASQTFNVVIGAHDLTIDPTINYVNVTVGGNVSYTFNLSSVSLDGTPIVQGNISSIAADLGDDGSWLTFDNSTMRLSGKPTSSDKGTTVTLSITDVYDDLVHSTIEVDLFNGLFTTTLPSTLNATVGEPFSFVLNDTLFAASDVQLSVSFKANGGNNYLTYDSDNRTITGTPTADEASSVQVNIDASSAALNQKQSTTITVNTINSTGQSEAPTSTSSSTNKALIIGLSVGLSILAILACLALAFFFRRCRKSKKASTNRDGSPLPPISRPYNTTPDSDWPLEEEKSWGEPRQLGGMAMFKRGVSGMFTLKTSEVGTTAATVGREPNPYDMAPEHEQTLPTPNIGGPRELPKAARGSWRRSDGRDWASVARSSDASLATVSTNEIFSVRLVQSPNPNAGGLNPISPAVGGVSPLLGGMGIRGAAPVVNVHPPPEENRAYGDRSQDTIGSFSEGSSGVDYEGTHWESAERMFPRSGKGPGLGQWDPNRASHYSVDSFQSHEQQQQYNENERGTWYQKRESSKDTMDDIKEYPVSRVSGPLSPISSNVEWSSSSGQNVPGRPRLVEFTKEKRVESQSSSGHGSGEVAFV
jgi:Putative Ig domain